MDGACERMKLIKKRVFWSRSIHIGMIIIICAVRCLESACLGSFLLSITILGRKGRRSSRFPVDCSLTAVRSLLYCNLHRGDVDNR